MICTTDFIRPRLFPIILITIFLMIGIWWQSHSFSLTYLLCISVAVTLCASIMHYIWLFSARNLIILCTITTVVGAYRYQMLVDDHYHFQQITQGKFYDLLGVVTDSIKTSNARLPQRLTVKIISLNNHQYSLFPKTSMYIYTKRLVGIRISDTIVIKNILLKHTYSPDFNNYLLKENVAGTLVLQKQIVRKVARPPVSFSRWLYYFRKELTERCQKRLDLTTYLYFSSIFLGSCETKKIIDPIKQHLQQWGIVHYLARSGLHVVIFIIFWQLVLRLFPFSFFIKELLLILLCIIYALFSWPSIPFHRAFFTFLVTRCCTLATIRIYYLPVLALVTIVTLIINPMYLFALDFQLSFGITAALAWFNEIQTNHRAKS
jgi:predicted membrane metal-binding protein